MNVSHYPYGAFHTNCSSRRAGWVFGKHIMFGFLAPTDGVAMGGLFCSSSIISALKIFGSPCKFWVRGFNYSNQFESVALSCKKFRHTNYAYIYEMRNFYTHYNSSFSSAASCALKIKIHLFGCAALKSISLDPLLCGVTIRI